MIFIPAYYALGSEEGNERQIVIDLGYIPIALINGMQKCEEGSQ